MATALTRDILANVAESAVPYAACPGPSQGACCHPQTTTYRFIMLIPVIMSGGVGSRLWPVSREMHPKQFLPLAGELSMLQQTLNRTSGLEETAPLVVCNEEHRFMVAE